VLNKLLQAEGQAPKVVLYGMGSGLTEAAVRSGMAVYASLARPSHIAEVRVLCDGFDLGWTRHPGIERQRSPERGLLPERDRVRSL
jgi:hypothetical protein